jgi:hypothetical protein
MVSLSAIAVYLPLLSLPLLSIYHWPIAVYCCLSLLCSTQNVYHAAVCCCLLHIIQFDVTDDDAKTQSSLYSLCSLCSLCSSFWLFSLLLLLLSYSIVTLRAILKHIYLLSYNKLYITFIFNILILIR